MQENLYCTSDVSGADIHALKTVHCFEAKTAAALPVLYLVINDDPPNLLLSFHTEFHP